MKNKQINSKVLSFTTKKLIISVFVTISVSVLFFVLIKIGIGKVVSQRSETKKLEKNITVLNQKIDTLSKVEDALSKNIKFFSLALPEDNPSLLISYMVKVNSAQMGLIYDNLKGGSEGKDKNVSKVDITFDLEGPFENMITFTKATENFSPIVTLEKLKMNQSGGIFSSSFTLRGYWAALPENIPTVTQAISDFTEAETTLITRISKLLLPAFSDLAPNKPSTRTDPFN